jgi:D-alanyl-D-alanine carboxypeptidase/D-alanyl-D-alanine-endopeptidase (penicillin-binding protein 4)
VTEREGVAVPERDRRHVTPAAQAGRRAGIVLLVLVLLAGVAGGVLWVRGDLDGLLGDDEPAASALDVAPPDGLVLPEARAAQQVLAGPDGGPAVSVAAVRARLRPLLAPGRFGRHVGVAVHDLSHDVPVVQVGGGRSYMPASTLKLLTSAAVLEALGPEHRFETTVTLAERAGRTPPTVTLVGGGDPLLVARPTNDTYPEPATLRELVAATARGLRERGVRTVALAYDDTLFTGPATSPAWEPGYVPDVTTPVSALWVDEGIDPATLVRSTEPAALTARLFADALRGRGIDVTRVAAGQGGGEELAAVQSPPLDQVVEHVIGLSDNEGAEVLLRHLAIATGRPATFAGGAAAMGEVLRGLDVPWTDVRVLDGSGLARGNRLPLETLVAVLRLGADEEHPDLAPVLTTLPVAGFDGTLVNRFYAEGTDEALGLVRAKTGTLTGTHALAGTVVDADGTLLGFVAVTNGVAVRNTLFARDQLDRITATLAACGCAR